MNKLGLFIAFGVLVGGCTVETVDTAATEGEAIGAAELALQGCPGTEIPHTYEEHTYRWRPNTSVPWKYYRFTVISPTSGPIRYYDTALDGPYRGSGTLNRWTPCTEGAPAGHVNEPVTLYNDNGTQKTCQHVCIGDDLQGRSRSELHCPNAQVLLTRQDLGLDTYCLASGSTPPETPPPGATLPALQTRNLCGADAHAVCATLAGYSVDEFTPQNGPMCYQDCLACFSTCQAGGNMMFNGCWGQVDAFDQYNCPGSEPRLRDWWDNETEETCKYDSGGCPASCSTCYQ